jgi:phosphopantothenoylcysteine decarboxylase/phosphopantothenate--cysteine ligase
MEDAKFKDKTVVVGVTGGIAAFKSASLCSALKQMGANVYAVMTKGAHEFIGAATLQGLTGNPVLTHVFEEPFPGKIAHIHLADTADLIIVAPATANFIAKHANGLADDMLSTILLATKNRGKIIICPAMNVNMYQHPATQRNLAWIHSTGVHFLDPASGRLACGYDDIGKLPDTTVILNKAREIIL